MNTLKSFLATHPFIGLGSSMGGGILPFIVAINPILQFLGLCVGLYIGWLTIQAKHAEKKARISPQLEKEAKETAQHNQNGKTGITYGKETLE